MRKFTVAAVALALMALLCAGPALAGAGQDMKPEAFVQQLWKLMRANDTAALDEVMSPAFQSVHADGARDKAQQLKLLAGLDMGPYELSDFQVTTSGDVAVVTYKVSVVETLPEGRTCKKPAMRLTIIQKTGNGWRWLAHANLKTVK